MSRVSHFRDLEVWQRGMDIVIVVYRLSPQFPKAELYGLASQIRRAAVSVPSNLAEGHERATTKEYLNHVSTAQASLAEVETQLEIATRLGYISSLELTAVLDETAILGKQLHRLRDVLQKKI